jgi:EAL domain-containing protein (putative c-di-GMP-specific phosphodiesterase class I)
MQGYLVSKPIPQDAVLELLMKYNSEDLSTRKARIPA